MAVPDPGSARWVRRSLANQGIGVDATVAQEISDILADATTIDLRDQRLLPSGLP